MKHLTRGWGSPTCLIYLALCLLPETSRAHSFGTPYVPPVPFWMYAYGCAATLVATFILLAFLARSPVASRDLVRDIRQPSAPVRAIARGVLSLLRLGAAACLLLTIVAGLIGTQDPAHNIGMTLFWVVFLLAFAYLTLFIGDIYPLIDPWRGAVNVLERAGLDLSTPRMAYPAWLAYWPAFGFYAALIWLELFGPQRPFPLSIVLLIYSAVTFAGAALCGKAVWFEKADVFSVFFRLVGRLAPVEYAQTGASAVHVRLRPPLIAALTEPPTHISLLLFVLFLLSSTTYDSLHETALWIGLYWKNMLSLLQPLWGDDLGRAQDMLMDGYLVYRQAGLVLLPFLYLAIWRIALPGRNRALALSYSLLPIAIVYHFAHYCSFLSTQGEELPKLLSDPFGFGWNLLGLTSGAATSPLNMNVIWHLQVAVVLLGHLASTYLAHSMALRTSATRTTAIVGQLPLLFLMVFYTLIGLWVLSLPLGAGEG